MEFVKSGKFRSGNLKFSQGKMMLSHMMTVIQYSMCYLSTFVKAILMLYDIKLISWTSSWDVDIEHCQ